MAEAAPVKERALVLCEPQFKSARALYGLAAAGIEAAAVWTGHDRSWDFDRYLARRNPAFSVSAFLQGRKLDCETLRTPADWTHILNCIEARSITLLLNVHHPWRVPEAVLRRLPGRALNLHPALLPACRGPHPLIALLAHELADRCGGATLHLMTPAFDEGPIVAQQAVPLGPARDTLAWELALARAYASLMAGPLAAYLAGRLQAVAQDEALATTARQPDVAGRQHLDESLTADEALRRARLFGQIRNLYVDAGGKRWRAMLPARVVGPRSGRPPRLGLWRLSFDVADARLSLRRRWPGAGHRQWRRRWRRVARAQP
jgi:methionyl-tRNA formyltransferase